jgi:hypothetical protein
MCRAVVFDAHGLLPVVGGVSAGGVVTVDMSSKKALTMSAVMPGMG